MKRIFIVGLTVISFSLCRLVNAQTNDNSSGKNTASIFNQTSDKVSNFFGSSSEEFIGTWNYKSTACKFETENLLKKAGGAVVATQVEKQFNEYCNKVGIKDGNCYFTFNEDSTYSAKLGLIKLSGKYSYDNQTNEVILTYLHGIGKLKAFPIQSGNRMKLMFDADGFLKLMKTLSTFTKDNSIEILAAMNDMYDGMLLGFDLNKPKEK